LSPLLQRSSSAFPQHVFAFELTSLDNRKIG
jgi:hypothetical protein